MGIFPTDYNLVDPILDGDQIALQDSALNKLAWVPASNLQAYVLGKQIGGLVRPKLTWSSITAITIGAGAYHHAGTVDQWVGQSALLTFVFGPAGSNSGSSAIGSSEWQYLYIDNSAVVTAASSVLTETEYIASTTVPTFNESKGGWYNGLDRAVRPVYINSAGEVEEFWQAGENIFAIAQTQEESGVAPSSTWTTYSISSCPTIVDIVIISFQVFWVSNSAIGSLGFRSKTLGGSGHPMAPVDSTSTLSGVTQALIPLDSSQQYEIAWSTAVTNTVNVNYNGFKLPRRM